MCVWMDVVDYNRLLLILTCVLRHSSLGASFTFMLISILALTTTQKFPQKDNKRSWEMAFQCISGDITFPDEVNAVIPWKTVEYAKTPASY